MAKAVNKKKLQQRNEYWRRQNKKLYVQMREAQDQLDVYEKNIAGQITTLTAHYEAIICYLMHKLHWQNLMESAVAEWAKGKEYALVADMESGAPGVMWKPVVQERKDDDEKSEVRQQED